MEVWGKSGGRGGDIGGVGGTVDGREVGGGGGAFTPQADPADT